MSCKHMYRYDGGCCYAMEEACMVQPLMASSAVSEWLVP